MLRIPRSLHVCRFRTWTVELLGYTIINHTIEMQVAANICAHHGNRFFLHLLREHATETFLFATFVFLHNTKNAMLINTVCKINSFNCTSVKLLNLNTSNINSIMKYQMI